MIDGKVSTAAEDSWNELNNFSTRGEKLDLELNLSNSMVTNVGFSSFCNVSNIDSMLVERVGKDELLSLINSLVFKIPWSWQHWTRFGEGCDFSITDPLLHIYK